MKKIILIITLFLLTSCSIDWNNEMQNKITKLEQDIQKLNQDNEIKCLEQSRKTFETNFSGFETKTFSSKYKNLRCYTEVSTSDNGEIHSTIIDTYSNSTIAEKSTGTHTWCFTPEKSIETCEINSYSLFRKTIFD